MPKGIDKADVFEFLDELRESGETNMFGAAPYVEDAFGCTREEARQFLSEWTRTFSERHPNQPPNA